MNEAEIKKLKSVAEKIAKKHHLKLVVLFGSQATGRTHAHSDVDLGVMAEGPIELDELLRLTYAFSEALHRPDVELVDLRTAPPLLRKEVAMEGSVLYEDAPSVFAQTTLYALKRFMETKPLRDLQYRSLKKFLQRV